jgi:hypothetical protein
MRVFIATWKPWTNTRVTLQQRVDMARDARAELAIKGSNSTYIYGPNTWTMFKTWPYKGKSNDDLEQLAKANGIKVQAWNFPYLQWPQGSADAINESINRWNMADVWLDVEGAYAKNYPSNTGPFLRSLGANKARYWLQSYRRPDLHREIQWAKWLTYKDPNGQYIIHGLGPQAYPIWNKDWPGDFARMVTEYEKILQPIGRMDMPWMPTLPTFSEGGWTPTLNDFIDGVDYLQERLGDRLVGIQFWRQDFLFKPEFESILAYIGTLATEDPPVPPRDDWFAQMDKGAKQDGWDITATLPPEFTE